MVPPLTMERMQIVLLILRTGMGLNKTEGPLCSWRCGEEKADIDSSVVCYVGTMVAKTITGA